MFHLDHPRLFQGAAVPGRRLGHHRPAPRAGHLEDGRLAEKDAGHLLDLPGRHPGAGGRLPPFSGFYSKDAILAQAAEQHNYPLLVIGVLVAMLTSFYMFRLIFVVFLGSGKSDSATHAHESPQGMLWPLRILATFSIIGGVIGIEQIYAMQFPMKVMLALQRCFPAKDWRG